MRGLLLDSDYLEWRDPPCMRLFVKTEKENFKVLDPHFRDYFFVLSTDPDDVRKTIEKMEVDKDSEKISSLSVDIVEKKLLGKKKNVLKVFVKKTSDISALREEILDIPSVIETYEHDIPPARKYLIDHELTPMSGIEIKGELREEREEKELITTKPPSPAGDIEVDLHIACFDLETYNPEGDPRPKKDPIIALSLVDNRGLKKVITWKDFETDLDYVEVVENEEQLIRRFVRLVEENDFDIITGYNTDLFDFPYLSERSDQYSIELNIGRGDSNIRTHRRRFNTVTEVPGRPHIDMYAMVDFLSKIGAIKLTSYTLENVYEHMFDKRKLDFDHTKISEAWDHGGNNAVDLLRYALSDAEATMDVSLEIFPLVRELSRTVKQSLFDVSRMTSGQLVEWLLISNAHKVSELVPPRPGGREYQKRRKSTYIGGYVLEPEKGLFRNLVVFDFRSLYPTIIVTHNIDPAMLNCDCCSLEERVKAPGLEYEFCQSKRGFIPETLDSLIEDRVKLKEEMKDLSEDTREYASLNSRQWALKIIANSFYGMLGYARARWYSKECAESVTRFGRHYIKETIKLAKDEGFEVVYGDTDSLFCKVGSKSKDEVRDFLNKVNENMPGIMKLELEDFYKRGLFIAKKRYAMINEAGKIEVKGLEFVRRDWAALAKDTQEAVLEAILKDGSPEKAAEIVQNVTEDIKKGKVDLNDLIVHTRLKKPIDQYKARGPHVAAAERLESEGEEVETGSTITYIVEKGSGSISDRAIPVSQFEGREYDPDYYVHNQVLPAVFRVMEVLGYTEEELCYEKTKQTKLGSF